MASEKEAGLQTVGETTQEAQEATSLLVVDTPENPKDKSSADHELKTLSETEDCSDEDDEDNECGLNFSWTTIPKQHDNMSMSNIINEEAVTLTFADPIVEGDALDQDDNIDASQFAFGLPNDESTNMDTIEEEDHPPVKEAEATVTVPEKPKDDQSVEKVLNLEEHQDLVVESDAGNTEPKETIKDEPSTPEVGTIITTPLRRSARKGSRDDMLRTDTLPIDKTPAKKTPRKSKTVAAPLEDLETITEENSVTKASTEPEPTESHGTEPPATPTIESLPETKSARSLRTSNTKTAELLEKAPSQEVVNVLKETQTPATPVRRSRRLSGATPVHTPVFNVRSRKISGALNKTSTDTPTIHESEESRFDTLELRSRTVTETLSRTEDFGCNEADEETKEEAKEGKKLKRGGRAESSHASPDIDVTVALSNPSRETKSASKQLSIKTPVRKSSRSSRKDTSLIESPKGETPKRTSRYTKKVELSDKPVEAEVPVTPAKPSSLPKHITPLKTATPKKEEITLTPTRRTRRVSSSDLGSGEPLTPVRRSRRLSGVPDDLSSAPDGGLITGATPRRTPRGRRHNTSVRAEDVETALSLATGPATPLPTLVEEEQETASTEVEAAPSTETGPKRRGRKPATAKPSTPSLNIIEEESDKSQPEQEPEPVKPARGKRKQTVQEAEDVVSTPPAKRVSRRVTITTLDTDVDLFTPVRSSQEAGSSRRRSAAPAGTKKYIAVKKKTKVKIK